MNWIMRAGWPKSRKAKSRVSPGISRMVAVSAILAAGVPLVACQSPAPATINSSDATRPLDHLPALSGDYFEYQGGADAFQAFLKSELIPEVESRYRADSSRRVLFGQSRGGYMVLYSAFTDPDLFWGRIASNPAFDPGRDRFFSPAAPATRNDLGLVVTSGSRDFPELREPALEWFQAWEGRNDVPWALNAVTIQGGTHAADSPNSYRLAMDWLFNRNESRQQ